MNNTCELTELIGNTSAEGLATALSFNSEFYSDRYSEEYTYIPSECDYRLFKELSFHGVGIAFDDDMGLAE